MMRWIRPTQPVPAPFGALVMSTGVLWP